jgi:hypothetical protein
VTADQDFYTDGEIEQFRAQLRNGNRLAREAFARKHGVAGPFKLYAIREIATGWWLPQAKPTSVRGASHVDPDPHAKPRLFWSKKSAQNALSAWCQGIWKVEGNFSSMDALEPSEPELTTQKVEGRHREDFEIVPMQLGEVVEAKI